MIGDVVQSDYGCGDVVHSFSSWQRALGKPDRIWSMRYTFHVPQPHRTADRRWTCWKGSEWDLCRIGSSKRRDYFRNRTVRDVITVCVLLFFPIQTGTGYHTIIELVIFESKQCFSRSRITSVGDKRVRLPPPKLYAFELRWIGVGVLYKRR